jgi:biopolymer transport protein ExbB/TolQ
MTFGFAIVVAAGLGYRIEEVVFAISKVLFYPVLIATLACLVWVLVEFGYFLYEVYLRVRYRDLEALEIRALKARDAFDRGQPRRAYRLLLENNYSVVVARFLFELIRNYQTQRLAEKPLKLLQEYEFYTIKRLEKTRILVRVGPLLGLMGTLIPLAPALQALADGDTERLADGLTVAFSVTVLGLFIGGLAFIVSIFRDRFYSQDISDLEYLLELLEGRGGQLRIVKSKRRKASADEVVHGNEVGEEETGVIATLPAGAVPAPAAPEAAAVTPALETVTPAAVTAPPEPFVRPAAIVPGADAAAPDVSGDALDSPVEPPPIVAPAAADSDRPMPDADTTAAPATEWAPSWTEDRPATALDGPADPPPVVPPEPDSNAPEGDPPLFTP